MESDGPVDVVEDSGRAHPALQRAHVGPGRRTRLFLTLPRPLLHREFRPGAGDRPEPYLRFSPGLSTSPSPALAPAPARPSSCGKRGPLFIAVRGPLTIAASVVAEHRLQTRRLSNCGSRA